MPSRLNARPKDSRRTDALPTAVASGPHAVRWATQCAKQTYPIKYNELSLRGLIPAYVSKSFQTHQPLAARQLLTTSLVKL